MDNEDQTINENVDASVESEDNQGIDLVAEAGVAPAAASSATTFDAKPDDRARARGLRTRTAERLAAEPQVSLYVPEGQPEMAKINGVLFKLPAGEETTVPQSVAKLIQAKWRATARSNKPRQLDLGTL